MTAPRIVPCKNADTPAHRARPAVYPGPRCATCWREEKKRRRQASKEKYVERTYSLSPEEYDSLLAFQGGKCAICQRATGKARRLAVDHDHACCAGPISCGRCIRGLACKPCNTFLLGRYGLQALLRACRYLLDPPAAQWRRSRS